jgi:rhomboid protease GluP
MDPPPDKTTLCPGCGRLIRQRETRCPYCGLQGPGAPRRAFWHPPGGADIPALKALVTVNILLFGLSLVLFPGLKILSWNPLQALSPSTRSLLLLGATGTVPIDRFGRWWTLISAGYLHGGLLHLVFNLLALVQLAPLVVKAFGLQRATTIYCLGSAAGFAVSYLAGVELTIGASAAICALMGAALYYGRSRGGVIGQAIYRQIGGWAVSLFLFGALFPGINNWGHAGGLAAGVLLGRLLGWREAGRAAAALHRFLAVVCIAATGVALVWAVTSAAIFRTH